MDCRLDSFKDNLPELKLLFPQQWEDTKFSDGKETLNPDINMYLFAEENDLLIFLSLKEKEKLIGYFIGFKTKAVHSQDFLHVIQDSLFVHPDYRGKGYGIKLIKKNEELCKGMGVSRIFLGSRFIKSLGNMLERLGYHPTEFYHSKYIGN